MSYGRMAILLMLIGAALERNAYGDECQPRWRCWVASWCCGPERIADCCWCPDDYCPKPLPCVLPNLVGCIDDYCSKPWPCVSPNAFGCIDDYCPKPCPPIPRLCEPWYECGPCELCCPSITHALK